MNTKEIRSLTGLRAVAALGVYLNHFGNPAWFPNRLSNIQSNGGFAVPFFFVLSGFVLALAYEGNTIDTRAFYLNRFARIGPTYFVALFIAAAYVSLSGFTFDHIFIMHLFGLQAWFPTPDSGFAFNGPGWTISVEIFFYALFPLLFSVFNSSQLLFRKWQFIVFSGISISVLPFLIHIYELGEIHGLGDSYFWPYPLPLHYLGLFIMGIGGFKARDSFRKVLRPTIFGAFLCDSTLIACALLLFFLNFKDPTNPQFAIASQFWLLGIPFTLSITVLSVVPLSPLSRLLGSNIFWFAGKISMVFYLLHIPVTWWIYKLFPSVTYEMRFLSIVVATIIVHFLIELPANRYIKNFRLF